MTEEVPHVEDQTISVPAMREVLAEETFNLTKITELRIKELTQIVDAYAKGDLTPDQAMDRFGDHIQKWGDSLPYNMDTDSLKGLTDAQIAEKVDKHYESGLNWRELATKRRSSDPGSVLG